MKKKTIGGVAMLALFLLLTLWGFRPGGKAASRRAKYSIFEEDDTTKRDDDGRE